MVKPKGIQWLDDHTGEDLGYACDAVLHDRHLSVRLGDDLANGLDATALVDRLVSDAPELRRRIAG